MKLQKVNECRQSGNIAHVDIRNGAHGPYGTIGVIIDDGYMQRQQKGQQGQWVDRTYYVEFKLGSSALKNSDTLNKGDYVLIESKLVQEQWKDKNTKEDRSTIKLEVKRIVVHMERDTIKQLNSQQRQNQQQGGGYNQQRPQNNGHNGGYQQEPPQEQGGYQQQPPQGRGGYQSEQYQTNSNGNGNNGQNYQQRPPRQNSNQQRGGYGTYDN